MRSIICFNFIFVQHSYWLTHFGLAMWRRRSGPTLEQWLFVTKPFPERRSCREHILEQFGVNYRDSKVHGAHLGPAGPRWARCWPHELCYLGNSFPNDAFTAVTHTQWSSWEWLWGWRDIRKLVVNTYENCWELLNTAYICTKGIFSTMRGGI